MTSQLKNLLKNHWKSLICFFVLIVFIQFAGAVVTFPNIPVWYAGLQQPPWTPPNWLFGPVWTVLYIMLAIVGWRLWLVRKTQPLMVTFYFLQLFLNAIWSPLFFWFHWVDVALIDLLLVILFTVRLFIRAYKFNRPIAYCLIPYLLWLCYAASLNGAIAVLN